ncbi:telomere-associated protein RIF1-like isoform X3 [Centruroides sculpturatus]|uniref:telomere-associated protein RIF1-like isoform X1 n=1 Tax=Centruroides sculpturatus TaxID=218467 RepID=UPI000C6DE55E|nr:telomere-associated protein RIF1-like isoform X1 [Centruroides sculpturatus]XP_023232996.1 telomere-associated protein RIF1-like isoform X1 [Centruroides sculpturatus]XP_023232997.1 telomere-associated protein RIF1-like isoform X2 [Centruroides sculpturatus]XP_023232998.1 telomere-associated protein RIF1-like isoform X3 [Centruroides sculpturatus]
MAPAVLMRKLKKAVSEEDRLAIYRFLKGNKNLSPVLYNEKTIQPLISFLLKDITFSSKNQTLQLEALCVLEIVLSYDQISESLKSNTSQEILISLLDQLKEITEENVCAEFISCLTVLISHISADILNEKLPELFELLEKWLKDHHQHLIICQICHLIHRLVMDCADVMIPHVTTWSKWILMPVCHQNNQVREIAMKNLELCVPIFMMTEKTVLPIVVSEVKTNIVKEMSVLYNVDKFYVLKLWGNIITVLGKILHKGSSFINSLLEIIEKAFKSEEEYIHAEALCTWQNLINNFSTDLEIMANHKRLKLLLQPLKLNKMSTERIAVIKCQTWWHLIWQLDSKLFPNFEMVCIPLLQFAFASYLKDTDTNTPLSPALTRSGKKNDRSSLGPKNEQVQKLGYEILIRLLEPSKKGSSGGLNSPKIVPNISLLPLKSSLPNSVYIQNIHILIHATKVALCNFGYNSTYVHFNYYIVKLLTVRTLSITEDKSKMAQDAVVQYLQFLSNIVVNKYFNSNQNLKFLDDVSLFPKEILTTYQCNIEYGHIKYNVPLMAFLSLMLGTDIIAPLHSSDKYLTIFSRFLSYIRDMPCPLKYFTSVMEMLSSASNPEIQYKIWSQICVELLEIIQKTQEVNQGSGSSYDFTCFLMVFSYPLNHFITCNLLQACEKQLWKNWCDLYKAFVRCATLVQSAQSNISCELVCRKIREIIPEEMLQMLHVLTIMCQLIETIIDSFDYNSWGKDFSVLTSWEEKNEKPLHNMTSCVLIIEKLLSAIPKLIEVNQDNEKGRERNKQVITCANNLLEIVKKLVTNISSSSLLITLFCRLAPFLIPFFKFGRKDHVYEKISNTQFFNSLESFWTNCLLSLQLHYSGPYDTEILTSIAPLLEVCFFHMRQSIVDRTRQFWYLTFGCNLSSITLPTDFRNAIKKLKPALIPNISSVKEMSNSISEDSVEIPMHVSFNAENNTPMKSPSTKTMNGNQQKSVLPNKNSSPNCLNSLEDLDDQHFVRIETPVKNKQILTEHQKEVRRRRSYVPAMYNDLSQETAGLDSQSDFSERSNEHFSLGNSTKLRKHQEKNSNGSSQQPIIIIESIETIPLSSDSIEAINNNSLDGLRTFNSSQHSSVSLEIDEPTLKYSQSSDVTTCQNKILPSIEKDIKLKSSPVIVLEDCSLNMMTTLKENSLSLSSQPVIEETCNENLEISKTSSFVQKMLVVDNEKQNKGLSPCKQGVMTLVKNDKRNSNLFPKLSQENLKVEAESSDDEAIPSSQDSLNRSGLLSFNKSQNRKDISLNKSATEEFIDQSDDETPSLNDSNDNIHSENSRNSQSLHLHILNNESKSITDTPQEHSEHESVKSSSSLEDSSSESVNIISAVDNSKVIVDLTNIDDSTGSNSNHTDSQSKGENVNSSQSEIESENLEEQQIQEEFESQDSLQNNNDENYSQSSNSYNESCDDSLEVDRCLFYNSEAKRRKSQRKLMPTRRVVESLLHFELSGNNSIDSVNYKELLKCKGTFSPTSKKFRYSSNFLDQQQNCIFSKTKRGNVSCPLSSDNSPMLTHILSLESKEQALNDLLTKPLSDSILKKTNDTIVCDSGDINDEFSVPLKDKNLSLPEISNKSCTSENMLEKDRAIFSSNQANSQSIEHSDKLSNNFQKINDGPKLSELEKNKTSLQEELEQTPELKKTVETVSTSSKRNLRPKVDKAGKLKSIELEKLFLEKDRRSSSEESFHEKEQSNVETKQNLRIAKDDKPKGAQRRKMKTTNMTSSIVSRLRTRSTLAKQRAIQKPRMKGRPKSRNGITHRHKPKRYSNVLVKSLKSSVKDDDKISTECEDEKENNNCAEIETTKSNDETKEVEFTKVDNDSSIQEKESDQKVLTENESPKEQQMIKNIRSDSPRKRCAMEIRQYHKKPKTTLNLLISPLSRSQKILRAAIGNFTSQERGMPWKSSKSVTSPSKSKPTASNQDSSPDQSKSHSPWVKHSYSPSASPTAGILKRKQMNDECNNSLSPPQKQRKVSFADPLVEYEIPIENCYACKVPQKNVSRCLEMTKGAKQALSSIQAAELEKNLLSSESSPYFSEEYQNTPLSLYDSEEKVFPALSNCSDPVDSILPFLTCSIWPRGLGQLVHARNICTIGDLCSLTIAEMLALPIKSPKLETARKVLQHYYEKFHKDLERNLSRSIISQEVNDENTSKNSLNASVSELDDDVLLEECLLSNDRDDFLNEDKLLNNDHDLIDEERLLNDQKELLDENEEFSNHQELALAELNKLQSSLIKENYQNDKETLLDEKNLESIQEFNVFSEEESKVQSDQVSLDEQNNCSREYSVSDNGLISEEESKIQDQEISLDTGNMNTQEFNVSLEEENNFKDDQEISLNTGNMNTQEFNVSLEEENNFKDDQEISLNEKTEQAQEEFGILSEQESSLKCDQEAFLKRENNHTQEFSVLLEKENKFENNHEILNEVEKFTQKFNTSEDEVKLQNAQETTLDKENEYSQELHMLSEEGREFQNDEELPLEDNIQTRDFGVSLDKESQFENDCKAFSNEVVSKFSVIEESMEFETNDDKIGSEVSDSSTEFENDINKVVKAEKINNSHLKNRDESREIVDESMPMECSNEEENSFNNVEEKYVEEISICSINTTDNSNNNTIMYEISDNDDIEDKPNIASTEEIESLPIINESPDKIKNVFEERLPCNSVIIKTINNVPVESTEDLINEIYPIINELINNVAENCLHHIDMNQLSTNNEFVDITENTAQQSKEICTDGFDDREKESGMILEKLINDVEKGKNSSDTEEDIKVTLSESNSFNILCEEASSCELSQVIVKGNKMEYQDSSPLPDKIFNRPHCGLLIEENETLSSEEDNTIASISEMEAENKVQLPTEMEMLQSSFTLENLKKFPLLHLVGMLEKLTTAIRFKSEEREESDTSHGNNFCS